AGLVGVFAVGTVGYVPGAGEGAPLPFVGAERVTRWLTAGVAGGGGGVDLQPISISEAGAVAAAHLEASLVGSGVGRGSQVDAHGDGGRPAVGHREGSRAEVASDPLGGHSRPGVAPVEVPGLGEAVAG